MLLKMAIFGCVSYFFF